MFKPYTTSKTARLGECSPSLVRKYAKEGVLHPEVLSDGTRCYDDADVRAIREERARRRPGRPPKSKP
jgi:DNA-binding transcriptional MerR regulator